MIPFRLPVIVPLRLPVIVPLRLPVIVPANVQVAAKMVMSPTPANFLSDFISILLVNDSSAGIAGWGTDSAQVASPSAINKLRPFVYNSYAENCRDSRIRQSLVFN